MLLISLDTTRADRLGCYGYRAAATPRLDALARQSTLFEHALSTSPMTLPAHASLLSGLLPPEHGLRMNGAGAVPLDVPLLAESFRDKGYRTAAFVSSFVLDRRFGLARGFEHYDDRVTVESARGLRALETQRLGGETADAAISWLTAGAGAPFFCWVHLFDPHVPYAAPAEFAASGRHPYDSEISYVDVQVGRLIDALESSGLLSRTLVVVVGDHGESLGEHGEDAHSFFVYEGVMHVPLLVSLPTIVAAGRRVSEAVSIADVYPTLVSLFELKQDTPVVARSFVPALFGEPVADQFCYSESEAPRVGFGCAGLASLTSRRWRFISAPRPELYDRLADPAERNNLIDREPAVADEFAERLAALREQLRPRSVGDTDLDAEARQRLATLGYIAVPVGSASGGDDCDPKDIVGVLRDLSTSEGLMVAGRLDAAIDAARRAQRLAPNSLSVRTQLAEALTRAQRWDEAREEWAAAVRLSPALPDLWIKLATTCINGGRLDEAIVELERGLAATSDAEVVAVALIDILAEVGRLDDAKAAAVEVLARRPAAHTVRITLHRLLTRRGSAAELRRNLEDGVRATSTPPAELVNALAWLLATSPQDDLRDGQRAVELVRHVAERSAPPAWLLDTLAAAYAERGDFPQAAATARRAVETARAGGDEVLAKDIAARLAGYESGQPFRDAGTATTTPAETQAPAAGGSARS